ncbi:hypothetical protein CYY_004657 [Polysphondylium violaceum]|uniref:Uncharacterized protein n=1 Tax=Polysphondylium violaceum TaxID=133409 RepID=A0A8J4PT19_9MYCE|nr:hypothetical protein CYY_004657 [Polysphondylium violaceum]
MIPIQKNKQSNNIKVLINNAFIKQSSSSLPNNRLGISCLIEHVHTLVECYQYYIPSLMFSFYIISIHEIVNNINNILDNIKLFNKFIINNQSNGFLIIYVSDTSNNNNKLNNVLMDEIIKLQTKYMNYQFQLLFNDSLKDCLETIMDFIEKQQQSKNLSIQAKLNDIEKDLYSQRARIKCLLLINSNLRVQTCKALLDKNEQSIKKVLLNNKQAISPNGESSENVGACNGIDISICIKEFIETESIIFK